MMTFIAEAGETCEFSIPILRSRNAFSHRYLIFDGLHAPVVFSTLFYANSIHPSFSSTHCCCTQHYQGYTMLPVKSFLSLENFGGEAMRPHVPCWAVTAFRFHKFFRPLFPNFFLVPLSWLKYKEGDSPPLTLN